MNSTAASGYTAVSLAVIYILWGANFVAVDIAVRDLSPASMMGLRFAIAGAFLLPVSRRISAPDPNRRTAWRHAIGTSIPLFVGGSRLLAWGQTRLDSGLAAVIISTIPRSLPTRRHREGPTPTPVATSTKTSRMKENFTSGSVGGSWNRNAYGHRETGSGPVRHRASSLPDHPRADRARAV